MTIHQDVINYANFIPIQTDAVITEVIAAGLGAFGGTLWSKTDVSVLINEPTVNDSACLADHNYSKLSEEFRKNIGLTTAARVENRGEWVARNSVGSGPAIIRA